MKKKHKIGIEVELFEDDGKFVICPVDNCPIFQGIVSQGHTLEAAEKKFIQLAGYMQEYYIERSNDLDRWKPFNKGNWSRRGGTWFTVFGVGLYFRFGQGMKGGFYVPLTKMNITFTNHWKAIKK